MNEKHLPPSKVQFGNINPEPGNPSTSDKQETNNVSHRSLSDRFIESTSINSQHNAVEREEFCGEIRRQLNQGKLAIVNPRRKNGLIVYKPYHAEFAGPGAIVGGQFDLNATKVIAVGNTSLVTPDSSQKRAQAYKMRRQWVRLTEQIIDNPEPTERAQVILNQFEHWFDIETVADVPDEAFAFLVGVLPQTIRKVRNIELL